MYLTMGEILSYKKYNTITVGTVDRRGQADPDN
jgi:hypothetical protein